TNRARRPGRRRSRSARSRWARPGAPRPSGQPDDSRGIQEARRDGERMPGVSMSITVSETAQLERILEALLFLPAEPVSAEALADATGAELHEVVTPLESLREHLD